MATAERFYGCRWRGIAIAFPRWRHRLENKCIRGAPRNNFYASLRGLRRLSRLVSLYFSFDREKYRLGSKTHSSGT